MARNLCAFGASLLSCPLISCQLWFGVLRTSFESLLSGSAINGIDVFAMPSLPLVSHWPYHWFVTGFAQFNSIVCHFSLANKSCAHKPIEWTAGERHRSLDCSPFECESQPNAIINSTAHNPIGPLSRPDLCAVTVPEMDTSGPPLGHVCSTQSIIN